jgi:steroid delta-isomerase-like uncharacterized protein
LYSPERLATHNEERSNMAAEENKAVARRLIEEVFNRGNLDLVDELIAPEFIHHDPNAQHFGRGPEGFKHLLRRYLDAIPDLQITLEAQIAEGDMVVDRWTGSGTHTGELMGMAPTGKQIETTGISIHRISGGKIAETWNSYDAVSMLEELGVLQAHTL